METFHLIGQGWRGSFIPDAPKNGEFFFCWSSDYHRHGEVQQHVFSSAQDLEQFTDELDRDFCDYEPMAFPVGSTHAALELAREEMSNGE